MATHIGIGFSQDPIPAKAARDALLHARNQTRQSANLVIVFTTPHYGSLEVLHVIRQTLPQAQIIGGSTPGIILPESIETRGIAIITINSQELEFGIGSANNISSAEMQLAGTTLVRTAAMDVNETQQQLLFLLADGLLKDNYLLVNSIKKITDNRLPFFGFGTSGASSDTKTYQYFQEEMLSNSAVAVLLGGNVHLNLISRHGFKPLGKPRIVDKSTGNIIKRIDNKRAFQMYEDYFGEEAHKIVAQPGNLISKLYPLGIFIEKDHRYLVRNLMGVLPDGSLVCQGDVPQGSQVFLMIGNKEFCRDSALEAATEARLNLGDKQPRLIMIFESWERYKILGAGAALQEIQNVREILGLAPPLLGVYCLQEIFPFKLSNNLGESHIQNNSFSVFTLSIV